ncbi:hypothetical protein [Brucella pseudogrignonensis]|uniref:hypothetical protein n=1 Tax=Brucella pseudogrignonensis TaxID=419475 RepID=UPI003D97F579
MSHGNGVSTTNLSPAAVIDELIGNVTRDGLQETTRIPMDALARQLAADSAISAFAGVVGKKTVALLQSVSSVENGTPGHVYDDPDATKNGIYTREGNTWIFQRSFPDSAAFLNVLTGTIPSANSVQARTRVGVNPARVEIFFIAPLLTNTGPVTLSVNSQTPKAVLNVNGDPLLAGEWSAKRIKLIWDTGDHYQLLQDPDVEALSNEVLQNTTISQAAAEIAEQARTISEAARDIAAGYASDAVSQGNVPIYGTTVGATALEIPAGLNVIRTNGYGAAGDGLGNTFVDYVGNHGWRKLFSSSGDTARTWWESGDILRETTVRIPEHFPDLNALFDYLRPRRICAHLSVEISAGVIDHDKVAIWWHPDASQVTFKGVYHPVTILSAASTVSNGPFSHDVTVNLLDASNVAVGDWLFIAAQSVSSIPHSWIEGTWRVIAKNVNDITLRVTMAPTTVPALSISNISAEVHKTTLRWDSSIQSGLILWDVAANVFDRIVFDGQFDVANEIGSDQKSANGLSAVAFVHAVAGIAGDVQISRSSGVFRKCSFNRWKSNGCLAFNGHLDIATSNFCSSGWRGTQAGNSNASLFGKACVISGNRKSGASFENGASFNHNNCTIAGNGEQGLYGIGGGNGIATGAKILLNVLGGADIRDSGFLDISNAKMRNNFNYQVVATGHNAIIRVDGIDTGGSVIAALRVNSGGTIMARIEAPTIAEAIPYSIALDSSGNILMPGVLGEMRTLYASSTTAPHGGFAKTPLSTGGAIFSTRASANAPKVDKLYFTNNALRPAADLDMSLGAAANAWETLFARRAAMRHGPAPAAIPGHSILYFDENGNPRVRAPDGRTGAIQVTWS